MKIRIASPLLLIASLAWWLTACTNAEPSQRPRLLTSDAARIATTNGIEMLDDAALDHSGEMMGIRVMSCVPPSMTAAVARSGTDPSRAKTPRLVIGEPACLSITATAGPRRID
jgi:hypothetical protein